MRAGFFLGGERGEEGLKGVGCSEDKGREEWSQDGEEEMHEGTMVAGCARARRGLSSDGETRGEGRGGREEGGGGKEGRRARPASSTDQSRNTSTSTAPHHPLPTGEMLLRCIPQSECACASRVWHSLEPADNNNER